MKKHIHDVLVLVIVFFFPFNQDVSALRTNRVDVGGTIWADMIGPGTSGVGAPVLVNGQFQFVATLPPFLAYPADSGTYYRVIVATTAANLTGNCAHNDGTANMIKVINCGLILHTNFNQFTGQITNQKTFLNWSAVAEQNINKYEIEKSTDAVNYNTIASVNAKNINEAFYNFSDPEIITGNTYYRIKMIDMDGLFKYSGIVLLSPNLIFGVKPVKNPFRNIITTEVITPQDGYLNLSLFNNKGQLIMKKEEAARKGINTVTIENIKAPDGIYFLFVNFKNETIKTKLIKVN